MEIAENTLAYINPGEHAQLLYKIFITPIRERIEKEIRVAMADAFMAGYESAIRKLRSGYPEDIPATYNERIHHQNLVIMLDNEPNDLKLARSGIR